MTEPARKPLGAGVVINVAIILLGLVAIAVLLVSQAFDSEPESSVPLDFGVQLEVVASGLDKPVFLAQTGDGSGDFYVAEQRGRIRRLTAEGELASDPFLDISGRVVSGGEQGLLGFALHPDHAAEGRLFVAYTRREDGALSISEFTRLAGAATADPGSERALLTIPEPDRNHNGGMVAFDPDGMLLVGVGDGGPTGDPDGNGQDRASLLATLLRLDVDRGWPYTTPTDNGFADDPEARPEIHAIGLRNPWRFSVDEQTGHVYIGDVGRWAWEEVNVLPAGARDADFGWAEMEGRECFDERDCDPAAHLMPAVAYPHADGDVGHCSVIGGYVYRGTAGTLADGTYLYGDYCSGTIWAAPASALVGGDAEPDVVGRVPGEYGRVTSFGQDDAGELYLLTEGGYVLGISAAEPAADPT